MQSTETGRRVGFPGPPWLLAATDAENTAYHAPSFPGPGKNWFDESRFSPMARQTKSAKARPIPARQLGQDPVGYCGFEPGRGGFRNTRRLAPDTPTQARRSR